ncbi:MAG: aminotransferase class IV [Actinobacteria bacterium]|uniref:Unannotated protein n=1 Tax=freshwater metagenome TaxID=449393 RepID=A0A6J5Z8K5_9ZZZZ|nr:aminotransferase class IV [Actinomycetota bacterium]
MTTRLRWDSGSAIWEESGEDGSQVAVADSWLVVEGRTRALERHFERFRLSCAEVGADSGDLEAAVAVIPAALPPGGRWFPKVSLGDNGALSLELRPAQAPQSEVVAWLSPLPDSRRLPRRKGPELQQLGLLREEAAKHGAGEALLADGDGLLLEGAYSSLLWWEGDVLWAVPDEAPALPGVTRALILELAAQQGIATRFRQPTLDELEGVEVWLSSALHGIRAVTAWTGGGPQAGAPNRAPAWQQLLDQLQG